MRFLINLTIGLCSLTSLVAQPLTDAEILTRIQSRQPLRGAAIPKDIKYRLGATHVAGKYYFTKDPYLIEGAKKMNELGYGIFKVWFRKNGGGYPYNSNWNIQKDITLKQLAQHPY